MVAATVARDFANIFTPPPSVDFALLLAGDDIEQFEKRVDQFEIEATAWRSSSLSKLPKALDELKKMSDDGEDGSLINEILPDAIRVVESGIETFSNPMHSDPVMARKMDQLAELSASAGKFVRKLMSRIEKIRVAQHAALIDMYYGLLAVRSELEKESEAVETFDDPAKLGAFLRSHIA
jgi:hypothetical protein